MARTRALIIEMPPEIEKEVEELAEATGRSQSEVALDALQSYLESEMWQKARMSAFIKAAGAPAKPAYAKATFDDDDYDPAGQAQTIYSHWKDSEDD